MSYRLIGGSNLSAKAAHPCLWLLRIWTLHGVAEDNGISMSCWFELLETAVMMQ